MKNTIKIIWVLFLMLSFASCGGGGGGNSGGIAYSGATNQAAIDQNNADDIAAGAFENAVVGESNMGLGAVQTGGNSYASRPRALNVSQQLKKTIENIDVTSAANGVISGAVQSDSGGWSGPCGGSLSYTVVYDDITGAFNGAITFSNYCDSGITISGPVSFSGTLNTVTLDFINYTVSISSIVVTDANDSFTVLGTISFDYTNTPISVLVNILLKDNNTGKVYKLENFVMSITEGINYIDLIIQAGSKSYHPDFGYADCSTTTTFRFNGTDIYPSQGVLVCIGSNNTKSKLTVLSNTQYLIDADTNGDGTYDWTSGALNWANM